MEANEYRKALGMLWGGFLAAVVLRYGLRLTWFLPALGLVLAHFGAQRLQTLSRWYWYASLAAILGILVLLVREVSAAFAPGLPVAAAQLWLAVAFAVFALLGLWQGKNL